MSDDVITPLFQKFLNHLQLERRLSAHTIQAYQEDFKHFHYFLNQHKIIDLLSVSMEQIRLFSAFEHRRQQSGKTIARRLSAIRTLYRWLMRENKARNNPAQGVRAPKSAKSLPQILDTDEMHVLLEAHAETAHTAKIIDVRDCAILELFYSSALRLSELCQLRWQHINLNHSTLRIIGKGNKTRIVPLGQIAKTALIAWHKQALSSIQQDFVFPGKQQDKAITPRAIQLRLKAIAQRKGISKNVHPHLLRHSCASHLLESSGNLRAVQEMLGHQDITSTEIYTHLDFQYLAKIYDSAHPRARRK